MNGKLQLIKNRLIEEMAKRKVYQSQAQEVFDKREEQNTRYENAQKARGVIQAVAEQTQQHIEIQISTVVSSALAAVFPEPYEFKLKFVQRRNKTEADLLFIKNGNECDDILAVGGGGVADVVANVAFPLAIWSIRKTRNTMLWDEPSKFLHNPEYQEKASLLIKEVSEKLNLQIIMISDQKNILKKADKIFFVEQTKGVSVVSY